MSSSGAGVGCSVSTQVLRSSSIQLMDEAQVHLAPLPEIASIPSLPAFSFPPNWPFLPFTMGKKSSPVTTKDSYANQPNHDHSHSHRGY